MTLKEDGKDEERGEKEKGEKKYMMMTKIKTSDLVKIKFSSLMAFIDDRRSYVMRDALCTKLKRIRIALFIAEIDFKREGDVFDAMASIYVLKEQLRGHFDMTKYDSAIKNITDTAHEEGANVDALTEKVVEEMLKKEAVSMKYISLRGGEIVRRIPS